jgi:hypothetical protein
MRGYDGTPTLLEEQLYLDDGPGDEDEEDEEEEEDAEDESDSDD